LVLFIDPEGIDEMKSMWKDDEIHEQGLILSRKTGADHTRLDLDTVGLVSAEAICRMGRATGLIELSV